MDVVSNISAAIEIVSKLLALGKRVSEADFKMLLADLTSELGDAKLQAAQLKIDLASAMSRIQALERAAADKVAGESEVHDGAYIFGDPSQHYCTGCFDARGDRILLRELTGAWAAFGKSECPVCEKPYGASQ